ncbi:MAG: DUF2500 domain-containing protein [Lachnospiraceae bacterium]|nr:DUF2500 domain-containing protein [Lachnospiraceae bacterium]
MIVNLIGGIEDAFLKNASSPKSTDDKGILIVLIYVVIIVSIVAFALFKKKIRDKFVAVETRNAEIVELRKAEGSKEWYVVTFENGESKVMRNLIAGKLVIAPGDYGRLTYQGNIIKDFKKEGNTGKGIVTATRNINSLLLIGIVIVVILFVLWYIEQENKSMQGVGVNLEHFKDYFD